MKTRILALTVPLALALPAAPSVAAPAHSGCDMVSSTDEVGLLEQDPNVQTGFLAGAWVDPFATSITLTCWIQVNQSTASIASARAMVQGSGTRAALLLGTISYAALPGWDVYVCMEVTAVTPGGSYRFATTECVAAAPMIGMHGYIA